MRASAVGGEVVYAPSDPAVNIDASNIDEYLKTLDPSHLAWNEEFEPVRWTLRGIERREFRRILAEARASVDDVLFEVFRVTCIGIRGLEYPDEAGEPTPFVPFHEDRVGRPKRMSDESFRALMDTCPDAVRDVAMLSWSRNDLDAPTKEFYRELNDRYNLGLDVDRILEGAAVKKS